MRSQLTAVQDQTSAQSHMHSCVTNWNIEQVENMLTMSMESKIQIFALESYSAFHKFTFSVILTLSLCRSGFD